MICSCGKDIHPKRAEFLKQRGSPQICIECAEDRVKKKGGFMSTHGKTERVLIVADMDTISTLHKLSARAGTGVSKGVKMNQSYSVKHNK